jgi:hypothetical protein
MCDTLADAHALTALLKGPLSSAWLNVLAEPARGGYRRYLGWTMSLLPIPNDWQRACVHLAPLGESAAAGDIPSEAELLRAAVDAYGVSVKDVEALLSWTKSCD